MSTTKDMPNVTHMGRKIENIAYVGRDFESIMYMDRKIELVSNTNSGFGGSLLDGTMEAGFFGEIPQQELIGSEDLFNKCFTSKPRYVTTFNPSTAWLKFAYQNKIEYIAKQPLCDGLEFSDYLKNNLVLGNKIIEINNIKYRVRLIKGKTEGKQDDTTSVAGAINHYSEWNRLILPLLIDKNETNYQEPQNVEKDRLRWTERYHQYELTFEYKMYSSTYRLAGAICQENIIRGLTPPKKKLSFETSRKTGPNASRQFTGWRPVLEVVS